MYLLVFLHHRIFFIDPSLNPAEKGFPSKGKPVSATHITEAAIAVFLACCTLSAAKVWGASTAYVCQQTLTSSLKHAYMVVLGSSTAQAVQTVLIIIALSLFGNLGAIKTILSFIQSTLSQSFVMLQAPGILVFIIASVVTLIGVNIYATTKTKIKTFTPSKKANFFASMLYTCFAADYATLIALKVSPVVQESTLIELIVATPILATAAFLGKKAGWTVKVISIAALISSVLLCKKLVQHVAKPLLVVMHTRYIGLAVTFGGLCGVYYATTVATLPWYSTIAVLVGSVAVVKLKKYARLFVTGLKAYIKHTKRVIRTYSNLRMLIPASIFLAYSLFPPKK